MASDGISTYVSREEAVDLVAAWLNSGPLGCGEEESKTYAPFDFGAFWGEERQDFIKEREVVKDDKAAVHLMRNSLGGNHAELIAGRLAFTPPHARSRRDDITIQVVFFHDATAQAKK
ncbi:hypothetical protein K4F52_000875 [Lecanicillium sp. MT-2017a]|nr:hypothetical protein K4F52_000875 [Lecanicillium sp. MT-2017a]